MLDDKELERYAAKPIAGMAVVSQTIVDLCSKLMNKFDSGSYSDLLDRVGLFQALAEIAHFSYQSLHVSEIVQDNITDFGHTFARIAAQLSRTVNEVSIATARETYLVRLGQAFSYEFSEGDLEKIQGLLNQLRDQISNSQVIQDKHKERLLKKLEALQCELHKKMTNLDKLWGLAGEGAVLMQKYGEAARPYFDIIRIILRIAWATQGRAEELPSNAPNLLIKTDDQEIA